MPQPLKDTDSQAVFIQELTSEFLWKIDKNDFLNKKTGEKIYSPAFTAKSLNGSYSQWRLSVYPNGNHDKHKEYVSLFLESLNKMPLRIMFTFSLLNQDNFKINLFTMKKLVSDVSNHKLKDRCGFTSELVPISFITDQNNSLFKDNKLTIVCKVIVLEKKTEQAQQSNETTRYSRLKEFDKFSHLINDKNFSDVTVILDDGSQIGLHKCILASRSNVFALMFKHDMEENLENKLVIKNARKKVLYEFFRFIYTGKVFELNSLASELLPLADQYNVEGLKVLCEEAMNKYLEHQNALAYLKLAGLYNLASLKEKIIEWIALKFDSFISDTEFKEFGLLHPEIFYKIVEKNHQLCNSFSE